MTRKRIRRDTSTTVVLDRLNEAYVVWRGCERALSIAHEAWNHACSVEQRAVCYEEVGHALRREERASADYAEASEVAGRVLLVDGAPSGSGQEPPLRVGF
jgi:hypothetical protein